MAIGVCRDGDGSDIVGVQHLRHEDRRGAVRRADDADGGCVAQVKAKQDGNGHGKEDTELRRCAKESLCPVRAGCK